MGHPALLPVHEMCHFLHSFAVEGSVELLKFGGSLFKISSLTAIFPSQTENIQVTLPLENHLEGRVGFKTYENYFTAGAGWLVITFLILVNIAAQVREGVYSGLCTHLDVYVLFILYFGEGNGTPLQYSCLENPMDGGPWKAAVHGVTEGRTRLIEFTFTFHFNALEKEMETHSGVLAWRIPGTGYPGGLLSMGSHRVRHD